MSKKKTILRRPATDSIKFPTLIGIISLIGLIATLNFLGGRLIWGSWAETKVIPREVRITNITASSFTVSWKTDKPAFGVVELVFPQKLVLIDIRFSNSSEENGYDTHYVVADNLESDSEYRFLIGSNGRFYGENGEENGHFYRVKTALLASEVSSQVKLAYGQVINEQGEPAEGALVYLSIPGISLLSSLTSDSGYWMIPFAFAYSSGLTALADYQEGPIEEEILVDGGILGRSIVFNLTRNNKPVPPITLGQDADFRQLNGKLDAPVAETITRQGGFFPEDDNFQGLEKEFAIISPNDKEGVATFRPEIFGTAPLDGQIEVIIESEMVYRDKVKVDEGGIWRYSPPGDLEPGEHKVTVKFIDRFGQEQILVRNFVVLAAEGETAFTATPSGDKALPTLVAIATLKPTATVTLSPEPTNTPTSKPTATVTLSPEPTNTPTLKPIATATATAAEIPQTGADFLANSRLFFGGAILLLGLSLIFLF